MHFYCNQSLKFKKMTALSKPKHNVDNINATTRDAGVT